MIENPQFCRFAGFIIFLSTSMHTCEINLCTSDLCNYINKKFIQHDFLKGVASSSHP